MFEIYKDLKIVLQIIFIGCICYLIGNGLIGLIPFMLLSLLVEDNTIAFAVIDFFQNGYLYGIKQYFVIIMIFLTTILSAYISGNVVENELLEEFYYSKEINNQEYEFLLNFSSFLTAISFFYITVYNPILYLSLPIRLESYSIFNFSFYSYIYIYILYFSFRKGLNNS